MLPLTNGIESTKINILVYSLFNVANDYFALRNRFCWINISDTSFDAYFIL